MKQYNLIKYKTNLYVNCDLAHPPNSIGICFEIK